MRKYSFLNSKENRLYFILIIIVISTLLLVTSFAGVAVEDTNINSVITGIKTDILEKGSGHIWTRSECGPDPQNQQHYGIGDNVYINGEKFSPNTTYNWTIIGNPGGASCDPNIIVANGTNMTDENGVICFLAYIIQPGDCGLYQCKVGASSDMFKVNIIDNDHDGWDSTEDCDDNDSTVYPGAPEICDGKDNDCDGIIPSDEIDYDGDGFAECEGDCDDSNASINPDATEVCDGVDNDCDGDVDEGFDDTDSDGIADCVDDDDDDDGVPDDEDCDPLDDSVWQLLTGYVDGDDDSYGAGDSIEICSGDVLPDGYSDNDLDCDDSDASINPDATELCDGVDNDCDGDVDEGFDDTDGDGIADCVDDDDDDDGVPDDEDCDPLDDSVWQLLTGYVDGDDDGFGAGDSIEICSGDVLPDGYSDNDLDCDDSDASINPDATELCDGVDNDCDGDVDEGFDDTDGDGIADCVDDDDDDDGVPDDEDCDPLDASVWQLLTGYVDGDDDSYGAGDSIEICSGDVLPDGYSDNDLDCDDSNASINPGVDEICGDGIDNDCDGLIDEGITYYQDSDNDTFGNPEVSMDYCEPIEGYVDNDLDCDDSNASINPDATEVCDGVDNDCDGVVDEGFDDTDGDGIADCVDDDDDDDGVPDDEDCDPLDDSVWQLLTGYVDGDDDGFGAGDSIEICSGDVLPDGYSDNDDDCDDSDASINPEAEEICGDGVDNDCDGDVDEGITYYQDNDGDTFGNPEVSMESCEPVEGYVDNADDCNDSDSNIYPGAEEIPYDGIDQDCDGSDLTDVDQDGQNSTEVGGTDCDDNDDSIYLGAPELCDDKDNDCDGTIDEGCGGGGSNGGSGGSSGGGTGGDINTPPVAIGTANPEIGFITELISFDGSDSYDNGEIVNYTWDFKDGTKGYGEKTTHIFTDTKLYQVILKVTDDGGLSNSTIVNVTIIAPNNPPEDLIIEGPNFGHQNTAYMFNATAYDPDENDSIRYNFDWDDGKENTSNYMMPGIKYEKSHDWITYGIYEIEVYAEDESNARSGVKTLTIYIDVHPIDDEIEGYLLDENSDGTFDRFLNYGTGNETIVQKQDDGTYLIDADGDGNWDYIYDIETDTLTKYEQDYTSICLLGLLALILLILLLLLAKRDKDKKKKEEEKRKKQAAMAASKKKTKNNSNKKKTAKTKKTAKK